MTNKDRRFSRNQDRVLQGHKRRVTQRKWASALSIFVILCTVLPLVLPAFTLENETFCGYQEHTHSEACYTTTKELTCGYEEGQVIELEPVAHVHTDECWQTIPATEETKELICGYEEGQVIELEPIAHVHTDECWQIIPATEEGGEETKVLICEHEEGELIPQFVVHTHTDECWKITPATEETTVLVCGHEEGELIPQSTTHTHTDACYTETKTLTCTIPEHVHTEACLANPKAGVETYKDWAKLFEDIEKTGKWADDLVTIAKTQLGYHDVTENFIINKDGSKSYYSRYGAWYGIPYGEWCAMFASFCLHYSDIPRESFPWAAGCTNWGETLQKMGLYEEAANGYKAKPGDLVFFRYEESESGLDHVGIVIENAKDILTVIEGNYTHEVAKNSYNITDPTIMGYGVMPENPALNEQPVPNGEESSETSEPIAEESSELIVEESSEAVVEETEEESSEVLVEEETETETEPEAEPEAEPIAADHSDDPDVKRDALEGNTVEYPEAVFEAELDDGTKVIVNAPKGAFPAGTTMKVEKVDQDEVASVIEENVKGELTQAIALDITFLNGQGQEIEPQKPIKVQIINDSITPESGKATVVHIDDEGKGQIVDQKENEDSTAVTFESDSFSIYVVAYSLEEEVISYTGETFKITVTFGPEAEIPENAVLDVQEILEGTAAYDEYVEKAEGLLEDNQKVTFVRLFDITILVDGKEVQPAAPVEVQIELINNSKAGEVIQDEVVAIHFDEKEESSELLDTALEDAKVTFNTDGFSVYGIVGTTLQTIIQASDGNTYRVSVTYTKDAEIPEGATLEVSEILSEDEESDESGLYYDYMEKTAEALEVEVADIAYLRAFDISIVKDGEKVIIAAPVEVKIELLDREDDIDSEEVACVVHFADNNNTGDVVEDLFADGLKVEFDANGFSVYTVAMILKSVPKLTTRMWTSITSVSGLSATDTNGDLMGYYWTWSSSGNSTATNNLVALTADITGFQKTSTQSGTYPRYTSDPAPGKFYFEKIDGSDYYIYYYDASNTKQYLHGDTVSFSLSNAQNESEKTIFEITRVSNRWRVKVKGTERVYVWYRQGGYCLYDHPDNTQNDYNLQIFRYNEGNELTEDPIFGSDNTYAILNWSGGKTAQAMTATANGNNGLVGEYVTVMTKGTGNASRLFVPSDTSNNLTMWTFHWTPGSFVADEGDAPITYKISTEVNGITKYLKIDTTNGAVSLVDSENEGSLITVTPYGTSTTNVHAGQISLKCGNYLLFYPGEITDGFKAFKSGTFKAGMEWLTLGSPIGNEVPNNYFMTYSATKISASDPVLSPDSPDAPPKKVILYTRVWNGAGYSFFVINSNGEAIPATENGDTIEWHGSILNDTLWEFTDYGSWENGVFTPNIFYELMIKNVTSGEEQYLSPKNEGTPEEQYFFSSAKGVNLPGRTTGKYYTTILTWDDKSYSYAAMKVNLNANAAQHEPALDVVPKKEGSIFYFAFLDDTANSDGLHEVETIDNNLFGITMKMVNLENSSGPGPWNNTAYAMNYWFGNGTGGIQAYPLQGLLSTNLVNGYPTLATPNGAGVSGASLSELYVDEQVVNKLFIKSIYTSTGYFEYNSTQNYATLLSLNDDGTINTTPGTDFTVFQEIGTIDATSGNPVPTRQHGQFMPYNIIRGGRYADKLHTLNVMDLYGHPLPTNDPRYEERLYDIENPDYNFGMELEANFLQTPSGLDEFGHDIIFEFSGDDDFWLYVDDELVIDLGGIHSAMDAKVNFRTGDVYVTYNGYATANAEHGQTINGSYSSSDQFTTLYDLFKANYMKRNPTMSEEDIDKILLGDPDDPENYPGIFETKHDAALDRDVTTFKDDTIHNMRIFYFERGRGASNLHMRFNLTAVEKGTIELTKELTGVEDPDSSAAEFPYQIWYKVPGTEDDWETMKPQTLDDTSVTYKESDNDVPYMQELTIIHYNEDDQKYYQVTYNDVYFLKPNETAIIAFPIYYQNGNPLYVTEYKILECGINPDYYERVLINGTAVSGTPAYANAEVVGENLVPVTPDTIPSGLMDYIVQASPEIRPKVKYTNEVKDLGRLTIQKKLYSKISATQVVPYPLYDDDGVVLSGHENDPTLDEEFNFRLFFKSAYGSEYTLANMAVYHVKDPAGYYCAWDSTNEKFIRFTPERFPDGVNTEEQYETLTRDYWTTDPNGYEVLHYGEMHYISFDTSMNGSIGRIPAYYTVEFRDLMPGTDYMLVEYNDEIPPAYFFYQFERDGSVYNEEPHVTYYHTPASNGGDPCMTGTIEANETSEAKVDNYKGYVLKLNKTWGDAKTIVSRDPSYYAVYYEVTDPDTQLVTRTLVPNTIRELPFAANPQQLEWIYLTLPTIDGVTNPDFANFFVYEVDITGERNVDFTVDSLGYVTLGATAEMNPVLPDQGDHMNYLFLEGIYETEVEQIRYVVTYDGVITISDNYREFGVNNMPRVSPLIEIVKEDWSGTRLQGSHFSLTTVFDDNVSNANGVVAEEYLAKNTNYTLTETQSTLGYYGLPVPLTLNLSYDTTNKVYTLIVNPPNGSTVDEYGIPLENYYKIEYVTDPHSQFQNVVISITLTIKNRPFNLQAIKVDSTNHSITLQGAKFKLYKWVTIDGQSAWAKDPLTFDGSSELVTGANGLVPHVDNELPVGRYKLVETSPPTDYDSLIGDEYIVFEINDKGEITYDPENDNHTNPTQVVWSETLGQDGVITYAITIPNEPKFYTVKLKKVDKDLNDLKGSQFILQRKIGESWENYDLDPNTDGVQYTVDMTNISDYTFSLPIGFYHLTETVAPPGYIIQDANIYFKVGAGGVVTLTDSNGTGSNSNVYVDLLGPTNNVYTVRVKNIPGELLPMTGGSGTTLYTLGGLALILASALMYGFRLRRRRKEVDT